MVRRTAQRDASAASFAPAEERITGTARRRGVGLGSSASIAFGAQARAGTPSRAPLPPRLACARRRIAGSGAPCWPDQLGSSYAGRRSEAAKHVSSPGQARRRRTSRPDSRGVKTIRIIESRLATVALRAAGSISIFCRQRSAAVQAADPQPSPAVFDRHVCPRHPVSFAPAVRRQSLHSGRASRC